MWIIWLLTVAYLLYVAVLLCVIVCSLNSIYGGIRLSSQFRIHTETCFRLTWQNEWPFINK